MEIDENGRPVVADVEVDAINDIIDKLREVNEKYEAWDKLADASLEERGFNPYTPKDKQ